MTMMTTMHHRREGVVYLVPALEIHRVGVCRVVVPVVVYQERPVVVRLDDLVRLAEAHQENQGVDCRALLVVAGPHMLVGSAPETMKNNHQGEDC